ncbi:MAG: hypothetical protein LBL45_08135 [Treponema sp.]|jgi:hypothetical protein|nr:hypothetical protein [Treponema sp.]
MAKEAFEQSNGFSALTADELFFVNGGSSGGGWEGVAGAAMADLGATLATGGLYAMGTLTPAGLIGGAMFVGIGAGMIAMGVDMAGGNGLDKTQAAITKALGKEE